MAGSFSATPPVRPGGDGSPPVFIIHGLSGNVAGLVPMTRRMTYPGEVIGIQARGLAGKDPPHATVVAMAAEYLREVKAHQPDGPYNLCGYSFGGLVASEMARRLWESGDEVALVGLFDLIEGESIVNEIPAFEPATSSRMFRLLMSDYAQTVVMTEALPRLQELALGVTTNTRWKN